tara:strand:+ start:4977 stop:5171 length:195 start_codon:yes stop_codon:yes gene_type:complete
MDTVRRRMQLRGTGYSHGMHAATCMLRDEGLGAFYRGLVPNALKIVPNNAIRFAMYDMFLHVVD